MRFVVIYNTRALSTGVITGAYMSVVIKYHTGALSTGVITGDDSSVFSTI